MGVLVLDAKMRRVEVATLDDVNAIAARAASNAQGRIVTITVEGSGGTSGWTADTSGHPDAPTQLWYADLDHGGAGLVTKNAYSPMAYAYNDFVFQNIIWQKRVDVQTLRVWIHKEPAHSMTFKVIG